MIFPLYSLECVGRLQRNCVCLRSDGLWEELQYAGDTGPRHTEGADTKVGLVSGRWGLLELRGAC